MLEKLIIEGKSGGNRQRMRQENVGRRIGPTEDLIGGGGVSGENGRFREVPSSGQGTAIDRSCSHNVITSIYQYKKVKVCFCIVKKR